ncbi:transcription-repair coupling factor, partial [Desulfobacteraceae bacterium SEEP-SAG9]
EEPGDFAVRGGILDIFSPLYSDPLRIELFGDTVDSLRFFSPDNQRTVKNIQEAVILPAREAILEMGFMDEVIKRIRARAVELDIPVSNIRALIDRIKKERVFPGVESLMPLIYPELDVFFDFVSESALFILIEPRNLEK